MRQLRRKTLTIISLKNEQGTRQVVHTTSFLSKVYLWLSVYLVWYIYIYICMYGCLTFVMICRLLDSPHPTPILISYRLLRCSIPPRTCHPTSAETSKGLYSIQNQISIFWMEISPIACEVKMEWHCWLNRSRLMWRKINWINFNSSQSLVVD